MRDNFFVTVKGAAIAALVTIGGSVAAYSESLSDAMVSAYKSSGLLEQNRALLRATDEDVAIAQSRLRPTLEYSLGRNWSDGKANGTNTSTATTTAQLTSNFLIYGFGSGKMNVALQKEIVQATRDSLVGIEQQVFLRAVQAFLDVRSAAENTQLQANLVRVLTQELRAANDRFEVGEVTQTDVAISQARLAAARSAEASAQGALAVAREEYRAVTGHLPGALATPPALPRTASSLDAAKAIARDRHPDLLAAKHNVAASDMGIELSKTSMKPSLVGQVQGNWNNDVDQFGLSGGVFLNGTIYSGGQKSAEYRKAVAQAEAARAQLRQVRQLVDQGVANSWAQLAIASASLDATERQIRASRVALRGAREEASLGSRTTLDVLNAEQELLDAEANRIAAQSGQYLAAYALLSSMGLLTADHLKLGIATYDPEAYYNAVKSAPVHRVSPQGKRLDSLLEALSKN